MTAPDIGYARMCANVIHANIIPEVIGPYIICLAGKTWRVWRHGRLSPVVVVVAAVAANGMLERTEGETHISHTHTHTPKLCANISTADGRNRHTAQDLAQRRRRRRRRHKTFVFKIRQLFYELAYALHRVCAGASADNIDK